MLESPDSPDTGQDRNGHRHRAPEAANHELAENARTRLRGIAIFAAVALVVIGATTGALLTFAPDASQWVPAGAAAGCALVLVVALVALFGVVKRVSEQASVDHGARLEAERGAWEAHWRAVAAQKTLEDAKRDLESGVAQVRGLLAEATKELGRLAEQIRRGETPSPPPADFPQFGGPNAVAELQPAVHRLVRSAVDVTTLAAAQQPVAVLITLARRLQPLIHRSIKELDELESQVEDPDLLNALFRLDHLVTRARRQAESIAVLGGATARQIRKPVPVYTVLRQAIAEIEHYGRVKVLRPVQGTVVGHAVTEVIHLIAELVENATVFSPPDTRVQVQVDLVPDGLSIEIDDLGLLMSSDLRQRMNDLLAMPGRLDVSEQLKDGRIGLIVVAAIARRYQIKVRLERNERGGNRALVVLPASLLAEVGADRPVPAKAVAAVAIPVAAISGPPALPAAPVMGAPQPQAAPPYAQVTSAHAAPLASQFARFSAATPISPAPAQPYSDPAPARYAPPALPPLHAAFSGAVEEPPAQPQLPVRPEQGARQEPPARPALPRRSGEHMAPELRRISQPERAEPGGHNPGLLASYQRGRERADRREPPPPTPGES